MPHVIELYLSLVVGVPRATCFGRCVGIAHTPGPVIVCTGVRQEFQARDGYKYSYLKNARIVRTPLCVFCQE